MDQKQKFYYIWYKCFFSRTPHLGLVKRIDLESWDCSDCRESDLNYSSFLLLCLNLFVNLLAGMSANSHLPFGQRPQMGQCPIEHGRNSVHPSFLMNIYASVLRAPDPLGSSLPWPQPPPLGPSPSRTDKKLSVY